MLNPQVTTFIQVAESGSFSKAADLLFITPTAVMKQINALENRLETTLFLRTNQGLRLTEAGKRFLQDAKYLAEYSEMAIRKARESDTMAKRETIRIGASIMTPVKFLLDVWSEVRSYDPDLKIELIPFENTPENAREILKNLGKHIDVVAGIYDENLLQARNCQAARLGDKRISLAVPLSHPLGGKSTLSVRDLRGESVMLIKQGWNRFIDRLRTDLIASEVNVIDFDFLCIGAFNRAVSDNVLIMTVDGWEDVHPLLKIIPVDWDYQVPFGLMFAKDPSPQVESFINIVTEITNN